LGISALVGLVGTAYGIGGGSLMVPLCLTRWRLPLHAIAGATLAATLLTSALALLAYQCLPAPPGVAAAPDWSLGASFGLGGLVGAYLGARCQRFLPQAVLRAVLAVMLLGLSVRYLWPGD
ncbi:MAG: TSUP family transporter, partial [Bdellovibrio bacteriovorus]